MAVGGAEANVVTRKQMTLAPQFGRHVEFETRRVVANANADVRPIGESLIALHEHSKRAYAGSERLEVVRSVIGRDDGQLRFPAGGVVAAANPLAEAHVR